jgi:CheY-like chemotaxis protein
MPRRPAPPPAPPPSAAHPSPGGAGILRFTRAGRIVHADEGFRRLLLDGQNPAKGANVLRGAPYRGLGLAPLAAQAAKGKHAVAAHVHPPAAPHPLNLWLLPVVGARGGVTEFLLLAEERPGGSAAPPEREFLATLSHELRTPLNAIMGFLRLAEGPRGQDEERQRDYLRSARQAAAGLLEMFNNFLDLAKMDAGRLTLEVVEFDPLRLAEEAARTLAPLAHGKGVEIAVWGDPALPAALRGDPGRLRQILVNVLGNAVKFTDHGSVTVIAAGESGADGSYLAKFTVRDTGAGIPEEDQARIFESFVQRGGRGTGDKTGTGLGLAISRQLARQMGGDIGVDSQPGHGSSFWFSARLSAGAPPAAARPSVLAGARIVALDPNASTREALARNLAALGAEVDEAASPRDAQQLLERAAAQGRPVRLVIVDHQTRREAALGLAHTFRTGRREFLPDLVYLSTPAQDGDAEMIRAGGYSAVLIKPAARAALGDTLAGLLREQTSQGSSYKPARRPSGPDLANLAARRQVHILVAEDNAINQKLVQAVLTNKGYSATVVPNGKAALEALEREEFDLVLMDVHMPVLDGLSATREIRRRFERHLPVVAMTADTLEGDRERCLAAGMDDYLTKPIMPDQLDSVIEQWTGQTASSHEPGKFGRWMTLDHAHLDAVRDYAAAHRTDAFPSLRRLFESELAAALHSLTTASAAEDWIGLLAGARQAAQLAEGFGAPRLYAMAKEMENHCRERNRPLARDIASQLHLEMRSVAMHLERSYGPLPRGADA